MKSSEVYQLISVCDALIEQRQFDEALGLLEQSQGFIATWLKGKIHLSAARAISEDYMFKHYATMEMKVKYRDILNAAYNHFYSTVMGLSEASIDIREYLNQCLWRQLGQTENELARTKYWFPQEKEEEEEEDSYQEDSNWTPDPDLLVDYITEMKL